MQLPNDWLDQIRAEYPKRPGQWWAEVRTLIPRAIGFGATWNEILAGTKAYARYCRFNCTDPKYIRPAKNFYDWRVQGWLEDWDVPEPVDPAKAREAEALAKLMARRAAIGLADFREPHEGETSDAYRAAQDEAWNKRRPLHAVK